MIKTNNNDLRSQKVKTARQSAEINLIAQLKQLKSQNIKLKNQVKHIQILESKVATILKESNSFIIQNQNQKRMIIQLKEQYFKLQQKYNAAMQSLLNFERKQKNDNHIVIQKQYQRQRILKENESLSIQRMTYLKQIQNFKKFTAQNEENGKNRLIEMQQIIKNQQTLIKDLELKNKTYQRQLRDFSFKFQILYQQKETLINDGQYFQQEHIRQMDNLKARMELIQYSQIQRLKKQHLSDVQTIMIDIEHIKQSLNSKDIEIDRLKRKNQNNKNYYQQIIEIYKKKNEQMKEKVKQNQSKMVINQQYQKEYLATNIEIQVSIATVQKQKKIQEQQIQIQNLKKEIKKNEESLKIFEYQMGLNKKIRNELQFRIVEQQQEIQNLKMKENRREGTILKIKQPKNREKQKNKNQDFKQTSKK